MSQPVWVTPPGNLGTIPEGVFYSIPLVAVAPADTVYYQVIAGSLPTGMYVDESGILGGNPSAQATAQGIPAPVPVDLTSKFAVRAYTERVVAGQHVIDRLADRTFTITVTGQNTPTFVTPPGTVATYYDSTQISDLQIEIFDPDIYASAIVTLISGSLPPGLTISLSGVISGFVGPNTTVTPTPTETNYPFTLKVSNGVANDTRAFNILVYARSAMTADNTVITADSTFVNADVSPTVPPIILTPVGSIGTVRSDNFYTFQFTGVDFNSQPFKFIANTTPAGLTLDPNSGWLYGYIPPLGLASITYPFSVRAYETAHPDVISNPYDYSLTVTGPLSSDVVWLTPSNLGTIDNGTTSILYVQAVSTSGLSLQYQLVSGSTSNLPQGLQLLTSGDIAGRVSFDTFALDGGTTTFDVSNNPLFNIVINPATSTTETTFDLSHTFEVNAFSVNGVVNATKTFTITVIRKFNEPFDNLYIQAMPPQNDRAFINSFLQNSTVFTPELIYRYNDPNFGVAHNIVYYHAYGLTAATLDAYVASLNLNHYWKNLVLGSIETAQALDASGNVIYEIVYSKIIDDLVNNFGQSVGKEVTLPYPVPGSDSTEITTVYPNSLVDMRTQVIDVIGQVSNVLPRWMVSKQTNGQVLGFTPAWVIAYCNPGQSGQIAYNIKTAIGDALNLIDYQVDRYELDNLLTHNWDRANQQWTPTPPSWASFDVECHYQLPVPNDSSLVFNGGTGYAVGNEILIYSSQLGVANSAVVDPAYTGPNLVVSNNALTVTAPATISGEPTALATYGITVGSRAMFSVTMNAYAPLADYTGIGIANHTFNIDDYIGVDLNSIGFFDDGNVYSNNMAIVGYYPVFQTNGDVIDVAVDRANNLIWIRVNGGDWNNDSAASPTDALGGLDISFISGTVYPGLDPYYYSGVSGQFTLNQTPQYATPGGFTFIAGQSSTANNVLLQVSGVDHNGTIESAFCTGQAPLNSAGELFYNITGTNITGTGTGATWDIETVPGVATTFDGNSLLFTAPVDMYSNTQAYDKYLVFPKRNILE